MGDFSGYLIFSNWNGETLDIYQYKNGRITSSTKKPGTNPHARLRGCNQQIVGWYWACITVYYQCCTEAEFDYDPGSVCCSRNYKYCTQEPIYDDVCTPETPSEPDPNDNGNGGDPNNGNTTSIIDQSQLAPCMKTVFNSLNSGSQIPDLIQKFSGTTKDYNWKLQDGRLGENVNAQTTPYDRTNRIVTTTFDTDKYRDASDLSVARTILHESVHAYLVTYFASDPINANADYPDMVVAWMGAKRLDLNQIQHEEMVYSFVSDIASNLKNYGQSKGYVISDDYYFKLAWGGLEGTSAFASYPSTTREATRDAIRIELTGKRTNGTPFTQVGTRAGCQ